MLNLNKMRTGLLVLIFILFSSVHAQVWIKKINGAGLGNPLTYNPLNSDILYSATGNYQMFISRDRGYTWQNFSSIPGGGVIKSISVNSRDTLQILVGIELSGIPDRVMRTTDGGATWNATLLGTFSYFGKPVEYKPQHPDTVYTMSNDTVWRSIDFGATWSIASRVSGLFNSWCDAQIRPDSANIIYIGDNSSGIWKSTDHGATWRLVCATTGEIPSIAIDPLNPRIAYASKYSGGGGLVKTTNWGETWEQLPTPIGAGNTWWVTTSIFSEGYVYFGTYGASPTGPYFSRNHGASWQRIGTAAFGEPSFNTLNYGLLATDTLTVLTLQANGLWKLKFDESVHLQQPLGGEYIHGGRPYTITWVDTNISRIKIELTTDNGSSWEEVATVDGGTGSYNWTPPEINATACKLRISNAYHSTVNDTSQSVFTIYANPVSLLSPNGGEVWDVASTHTISWQSIVPLSLNIEFSADSGATWTHIVTANPDVFSFAWVIPEIETSTRCLFRIQDVSDSTSGDISDSTFAIYSIVEFTASLEIESQFSGRDTITFGTSGGAGDGIDSAFGESELSPKPVSGTFDARWNITGTNGSAVDIRDTLGSMNDSHSFIAELQPDIAGFPVTVRWDKGLLRAGTYIVRDTLTRGKRLFFDMRKADSLVINDSSLAAFEIFQCRSRSMNFSGSGDWELVSVPYLTGDLKRASLFPNSTSSAYYFSDGYYEDDSLRYGAGYWIKVDQVTYKGCVRTLDTIDVHAKWNMIGSLSDEIPVSAIQTIPESLIVSDFYGYDGGYIPSATIEPGKGYWIKTNGAGKVILRHDTLQHFTKRVSSLETARLNYLKAEDADGHSQFLWFGTKRENIAENENEMPPMPPGDAFDFRFSSQKMAEFIPVDLKNEVEIPIWFKSRSFKNIFSWNVEFDKNFSYILTRKVGNRIVGETRLTGSGSLTMDNVGGIEFSLRILPSTREEHPLTFSLSPNYPNPFNPVTRVQYTLPRNSHVTLRVVNLLGQTVAELANGFQDEGVHVVEWNGRASDGGLLSSGVYYMFMNARDGEPPSAIVFSAVRSLILIK